jgi:hypothetical protein
VKKGFLPLSTGTGRSPQLVVQGLVLPLRRLAQRGSVQGWNYSRRTSSLINHHGIIEIFIVKALAVV